MGAREGGGKGKKDELLSSIELSDFLRRMNGMGRVGKGGGLCVASRMGMR